MLLSQEELERLHNRFPYPRFSEAEYRRRYENIRKMMRELKLDCLLIIGGSAAYGRVWFNFRYVTNRLGKAEMANYCFFPKDGDPCLILRPGHSLAAAMLARTVVREIIVGDPSVLTAIVQTIQERGYDKGRVGIVEYDLQGRLGANPRHEPQIGPDRPQSVEDRYLYDEQGRLVYQPGMIFTLQMHIIDKQETRGLFLADSFVITADGPKCLNKFPPQSVQIRP